MRRGALKRTNILLDEDKVSLLRRKLRARSNSEAVRIAIDQKLATTLGLEALQSLAARGTLEDTFHRARSRRK